MEREEAIQVLTDIKRIRSDKIAEAIDMAIEALTEPILCEDCMYRNTWDNPRLVPQYYKCGRGIKFRNHGYVREDDYCPLAERREP